MLSHQTNHSSREIAELIHQIELDESRFERELRSVSRQKIILPVQLKSMNGAASLRVYSRNMSEAGVSLISERPFAEGAVARLQIDSPNRSTPEIIAECKWCRPFSRGTFISGWHFLRLSGEQRSG